MQDTGTFASKFETREELDDWILRFYEDRIEFYLKFLGRRTSNNVVVTHKVIKKTMERYLQLLSKKNIVL
jgi:hypothetical protein